MERLSRACAFEEPAVETASLSHQQKRPALLQAVAVHGGLGRNRVTDTGIFKAQVGCLYMFIKQLLIMALAGLVFIVNLRPTL